MAENNFVDLDNISSLNKAYSNNLYEDSPIVNKSIASRTFNNWYGEGRSIKSEYLRKDYEYFRPDSAKPNNRTDILKACQDAYDRVGVVRQVIDLMSDFGAKGVKVRHEIPSVERFYQRWWDIVDGTHVTERFFNIMYRLGTVPIYRTFGRISDSTTKQMKSVKGSKVDKILKLNKYDKNVIPSKYTFLNPALVDVFAKELANFSGVNTYIMRISSTVLDVNVPFSIKNKQELLNNLISQLPSDIKNSVLKKEDYIVLDPDRLSVFNYKKDDWQVWGKPIIYSILDDLAVLEKMKLADISALDGAISNVRLWRVGRLTDDPKTTIIPTKTMLSKLREYLEQNISGGSIDLVWGPEIDFKESSTEVYKFLGKEKYEPTLDSIYMGLGIPTVLRSDKTVSGNNQFVSMKTLLERLNYVRRIVENFWNNEFIHIQKSMGFTKPAILEFDSAIIADDAAEKQLLINLADRDIISNEFVREKFGANHLIEEKRVQNEYDVRGEKQPYKAGPFHNANIESEYNKLLLQGGTVTPSEIGIELLEKNPNQKTKMDMQAELVKTKNVQQGVNGRPPNITETSKRDKKSGDQYRISRSKDLELLFWANSVQKEINDILVPAFLHGFNKKNIRSLNKEETYKFELTKAMVLMNLKPFDKVSNLYIQTVLSNKLSYIDEVTEIIKESNTVEEKSLCLSLLYVSEKNVD